MKPCYYCSGRKVQQIRDEDMLITCRCIKCGNEVRTPYRTSESAIGCWNTKMADLEKAAKKREAAAS